MEDHPVWHGLSVPDVSERLATSPDGLSSAEAERRLAEYGRNALPAGRRHSALRRFLAQFHNALIYILIASAVLTALTGHWTDTGVIASVILVNALIGFVQERKAEAALAAVRDLLAPRASVLRDGERRTVDAALLVPGDVVLLAAGDKTPADLRLTEAHSLKIQEAILTGESLDAEKSVEPVPADAPLGGRPGMAYSGTPVAAGQGKGIVVATGARTEIGRIGALADAARSPETALTRRLARFSRRLAAGVLAASVGLFLYGVYVRRLPTDEMFMTMIGVAVSAVPEGLPAVISITMALGVRATAKRNAIVRRLPAIEALGSVTVICTDKTGTLTRNELAVTDVIAAGRAFSVTGVGYAPEGRIRIGEEEIEPADHPALHELARAALLNNDAELAFRNGVWEMQGDPTEGALAAFARKAGHEAGNAQERFPRFGVLPFSAEKRYMATLHRGEEGKGVVYVKGAPERVMEMCSEERTDDGGAKPFSLSEWQARAEELAGQGKRVLALACREAPEGQEALAPEDVRQGLTLLGLVGVMDAPREDAGESVAACLRAGIAVKMITGDHALTASAVGEALGIPLGKGVVTGADVERLSDAELAETAENAHIYARMHPEHKLRLVQALQSRGEIAAMTGDGVNDAPALKKADVGVAMGRQGTEAAKEAADMVLADDRFSSIVHAVEEGRNVYLNIRRTIRFMLVTDGAEGFTLLAATFMGLALPITPLQILWVNMVTAVTLSLAFAFAPNDPAVMRRPPLPPGSPLFMKGEVGVMLLHIAVVAAGTVGMFLYEMRQTGDASLARTVAVNMLVCFQIYYLWGLFPLGKRLASWLPAATATVGVLAFQLAFTYLPWMQGIFGSVALGVPEWLEAAGPSAVILIPLWLEKRRASKTEE